MTTPKGIGFYARNLTTDTHGTPVQFAKKLKDNGVSFVAFLSCWQDIANGKQHELVFKKETIKAYADECVKLGIEVLLWGFPWRGREEKYMETMVSTAKFLGTSVKGLLHDPEVSYKAKGKQPPLRSRGQGEAVDAKPDADESVTVSAMKKLVTLDASAVNDLKLAYVSGWSSYGMAAWHQMPWDAIASANGWYSPQLYSVSPKQVDQGIDQWRSHGCEIILPSVPTFGENSGENLDDYLGCFVNGNENISGFVFWSYPQTGATEWKTIARWAEQLKSNSCK